MAIQHIYIGLRGPSAAVYARRQRRPQLGATFTELTPQLLKLIPALPLSLVESIRTPEGGEQALKVPARIVEASLKQIRNQTPLRPNEVGEDFRSPTPNTFRELVSLMEEIRRLIDVEGREARFEQVERMGVVTHRPTGFSVPFLAGRGEIKERQVRAELNVFAGKKTKLALLFILERFKEGPLDFVEVGTCLPGITILDDKSIIV